MHLSVPLIGLASAFVVALVVSFAAINNGNIYTHRLATRGYGALLLYEAGAFAFVLDGLTTIAAGVAGVVA